MSYTKTVKELQLINRIDPRLECLQFSQEKLKWSVGIGSQYSNIVAYTASSGTSPNLSFTFNTQGLSTMINRVMYLEATFQVVLNGQTATANAVPNIANDRFAPRAYPLASIIDTSTVTINGTSVSMQSGDALLAMFRYCNGHNLSQCDLSGTTTYLDNTTTYDGSIASNRSPLAVWTTAGYEDTRGCHPITSIVGNGDSGANIGDACQQTTIVFTVREPIFVSPLLFSSENPESALIGVQNMDLNFNISNMTRAVSWNTSLLQNTSAVVTFASAPILRVNYLNIPILSQMQIPKVAMYNYNSISVYSNQGPAIAANATANYIGPNIPTSTVPKTIYIYVAKSRGTKVASDSDWFLAIQSLTIQFLNISGQFSSYSQHDLYALCVKNGYRDSFSAFQGKSAIYTGADPNQNGAVSLVGSVIKLDATDLALPSNLASGVPCNSNLQINLVAYNQSAAPIPEAATNMYVVIVNEGVFSISEGACVSQVSILSQQDVIDSRMNNGWESANYCDKTLMGGGSLWDQAKSLGKYLGPVLAKSLPWIEKSLPLAKYAMGAGEMVGSGEQVGGRRKRKGGELVGGQTLSRAELKQMLEN